MKVKKYGMFILNTTFDLLTFTYLKLTQKFPKVMSIEDTLQLIINEQKSFARYGDGEFNLISNKSIGFQSANQELSKRLREILTSNPTFCLICIPGSLNTLSGMVWKSQLMWAHLISRFYKNYKQYLNYEIIYPNSLMTRPYIDLKNKDRSVILFKKIKSIWEDRDILIIEGEHSKLGIGNDLFDNAKSIRRVITLSKDAFSKYDEILEEVKHYDKNSIILIALGAAATVLAYDLSELGFQACDIGHIDIEYEWFLKKSLRKTAVDGKFVNEVSTENPTTMINDMNYENQIIKKIV